MIIFRILFLILFLFFLIFVPIQYLQYRYKGDISCGGDWSYNVKCPLGTYCQSLNQGLMAGGICTQYLSGLFRSLNLERKAIPRMLSK